MQSSLQQYINGQIHVPVALARKTEPIPEKINNITRTNQQGVKSLTKATDVSASFKEYKGGFPPPQINDESSGTNWSEYHTRMLTRLIR
jgi:hypothetical protein